MLGRVQGHAVDRVAGARERPDRWAARALAQTGVGVDGDEFQRGEGCGGEINSLPSPRVCVWPVAASVVTGFLYSISRFAIHVAGNVHTFAHESHSRPHRIFCFQRSLLVRAMPPMPLNDAHFRGFFLFLHEIK